MPSGVAGIVGHEIHLDFLEAAQHHDVLDDARRLPATDAHELEAVAVEMQRVDIVARIAKLEPVALALAEHHHRTHGFHREGLAVERPPVEPVRGSVVLDDGHIDRLIRRRRRARYRCR